MKYRPSLRREHGKELSQPGAINFDRILPQTTDKSLPGTTPEIHLKHLPLCYDRFRELALLRLHKLSFWVKQNISQENLMFVTEAKDILHDFKDGINLLLWQRIYTRMQIN